jgi:hypothetical protein
MHLQWSFMIVDNVIKLDLQFCYCCCSISKMVTMICCFFRRYIVVSIIWRKSPNNILSEGCKLSLFSSEKFPQWKLSVLTSISFVSSWTYLLRSVFLSVDFRGDELSFLVSPPSPKCFFRQEVMCNLSDLELLNHLQQLGHWLELFFGIFSCTIAYVCWKQQLLMGNGPISKWRDGMCNLRCANIDSIVY